VPNYDEDKEPHILVIENTDGDHYVKHLDDCPKEEFSSGDWEMDMSDPLEYYTCRTQAAIDGNDIDDIENWRELPPGEYKIKSYYEYHPGEFGGSYGAEYEIGIFLVNEDDGSK